MKIQDILATMSKYYTDNTIRAYSSDMRHIMQWCKNNNTCFSRMNGKLFIRYITEACANRKFTTIIRRVNSVQTILDFQQKPNFTQDKRVRTFLNQLRIEEKQRLIGEGRTSYYNALGKRTFNSKLEGFHQLINQSKKLQGVHNNEHQDDQQTH